MTIESSKEEKEVKSFEVIYKLDYSLMDIKPAIKIGGATAGDSNDSCGSGSFFIFIN